MATTSLWRVKGHIGSVVRYAENNEKTTEQKTEVFPKMPEDPDSREGLSWLLRYAGRDPATYEQRYVTPLNCTTEHAAEEMQAIKRAFGKEGGTIAYHGYQSFREGEVTPEIAHEIGVKLANELWGDRYQVLVATHIDKQSHIHNHFVINTVSFVDGKKFCRTNDDYLKMRQTSDRLCREYHLSVVRQPESRRKAYAEWKAEHAGETTERDLIRNDFDQAIRCSLTFQEFFAYLSDLGYTYKTTSKAGNPLERPSLKPKDASHFYRFDKLGKGYTLEDIEERLYEKMYREEPMPEKKRQEYEAKRAAGLPKEYHKVSGLSALFWIFEYLLGLVREYPEAYPVKTQEYRKEALKLKKYDERTRLLCENKITTMNDLLRFQEEVRKKISDLKKMRSQCFTDINEFNHLKKTHPGEKINIPDKVLVAQLNILESSKDLKGLQRLLRVSEDIRKNAVEVHRKAIDLGAVPTANKTYRLATDEEMRKKALKDAEAKNNENPKPVPAKVRDEGAR